MVSAEDIASIYDGWLNEGIISNREIELYFNLRENHNLLIVWVHDHTFGAFMPAAFIKLNFINEN